jgi:2'-5' RNA ligase
VRLFVGVFPPAAVRADLRRALPSGLKLTAVEQWHVTLAFLGEVPEERLSDVEQALDGVRTTSSRGIGLRLAGGGRFANGRSVALWAGVAGDLAGLSGLRADVCARLAGYADRPFRPHLTIAYTRAGQALAALEGYAGPTWTVDEFVLVRSRYNEGGGYDHLRSWPC